MTSLRNILFALCSLSSVAHGAPLKEGLEEGSVANPICALENPIVSVLGAEASATAFCSSYLSIATQTFSATITTATSTSGTTTILDGTQVITDPTSSSTAVLSVTTTEIVFTTSDDTAAPTAFQRAVKRSKCGHSKPVEVPVALTDLPATALSSACSCLSIPTPSVTATETVTSTVSLTSTDSTFAGTTTFTPVVDTTTTATETATSTSTILKSDVLSTIAAVINQDSYQSFCSSILTYTTPLTTAYETVTATTVATESSTVTVTAFTTTTVIQLPAKRQEATTTDATPVEFATYPADYVTSACSMAVTSPATSTISSTVTVTTTETSVELATVTAQATTVITKTCAKYPGTNSGFETSNSNGWTVYNPIDGAGGSWSIVSNGYSSSYAAQVTMLNPDTGTYGGFAGIISQTVSTCVGLSYTVSFNYDCTVVNNGLAIYAWGGGGNSGQFSCPSAGSWYSKSFTFTATDTSTTIHVEGVQNGVGQGVILFDNIVVTLN